LSPSSGNGSCGPCTIYLRSHPAYKGRIPNQSHYFWETIDGGKNKQFNSGQGQLNFWGLYLNSVTDKRGDSEFWEPQNQKGPSTEYCDKVDAVRLAGDVWPNWVVPFVPIGPNSNTVASFINNASGVNFPEPPDDLGWDVNPFGR
jgi:hypothetical protein